jgi:hypothetical protein
MRALVLGSRPLYNYLFRNSVRDPYFAAMRSVLIAEIIMMSPLMIETAGPVFGVVESGQRIFAMQNS